MTLHFDVRNRFADVFQQTKSALFDNINLLKCVEKKAAKAC